MLTETMFMAGRLWWGFVERRRRLAELTLDAILAPRFPLRPLFDLY
jgi:hypothetical protein